MSSRAKADIRLKFANQRQVDTLLDSLTPEANAPVTSRVNIKLQKDGLFLVLTVEADDTVALRATLNSYLRWISSTVNVIKLVEDS
jgi:tRNA threonylcarbamoyladenosine modification (KEOPS) complex  Pcc1 subunit